MLPFGILFAISEHTIADPGFVADVQHVNAEPRELLFRRAVGMNRDECQEIGIHATTGHRAFTIVANAKPVYRLLSKNRNHRMFGFVNGT